METKKSLELLAITLVARILIPIILLLVTIIGIPIYILTGIFLVLRMVVCPNFHTIITWDELFIFPTLTNKGIRWMNWEIRFKKDIN